MPSDLNPQAVTTIELDCPSCGAPAEIIERFTLYGVPEPVEHVKVRCAVGHWYTIPTEWLASAHPDPRLTSPKTSGANDNRQPITPCPDYKQRSPQTTAPRAGQAEHQQSAGTQRVAPASVQQTLS